METKNKKTDELTKCKRFYSGELLFFAALMIVLGALILAQIIRVSDWKKWFFSILTFIGGIWVIIDLIWTIKSPKKRKKNSLVDKCLLLPNGLALIGLDCYAFVNLARDPSWNGTSARYFNIIIGSALIYLAAVYLFESIYHYFVIHPLVYEMMEEDKEKQQQIINNQEEAKVEEKPQEPEQKE